jgi:hypothetical protein
MIDVTNIIPPSTAYDMNSNIGLLSVLKRG